MRYEGQERTISCHHHATMINRDFFVMTIALVKLITNRSFVVGLASKNHFHSRPCFLSSKRHSTSDDTYLTSDESQTSLLWLRTCLRISDNEALAKAIEYGQDGLTVVFTWERGEVPATPSEVFECAAARKLDQKLRSYGNHLKILNVNKGTHNPIAAICAVISQLRPNTVLIDTASSETFRDVEALQSSLLANKEISNTQLISIPDNGNLFPIDCAPTALGRSRSGGRMLRWPTFLSNMNGEPVSLPIPSPTQLPPPLESSHHSEVLPLPTSAGAWAEELLERWGEVSEGEAIQRAAASKQENTNQTSLGNHGFSNKNTKLSPYLRWGVISPRQAYHAGVRKRDLLWRDWSHLCYRTVKPLRLGEPVLPFLDGCCTLITPKLDGDKDALFTAWCFGRTGAPLVDAGMRQLWHEGWMPRRMRLLVASCLVEGLGLDWRKGRDWFKYTLIDHDPAINELMWQNAGFCGIDLFYRGLVWESVGSQEDQDYVNRWGSRDLHLPTSIEKGISSCPPYPCEDLLSTAKARRQELQRRGQYKAAAKVANSGVRVAWENLTQSDKRTNPGDVIGVGRVKLEDLVFENSKPY